MADFATRDQTFDGISLQVYVTYATLTLHGGFSQHNAVELN